MLERHYSALELRQSFARESCISSLKKLHMRLNPESGYSQNSMKDRTGSLVSAVMLPSPVPLQPEHPNLNYAYRILCIFNGEARRHCMTGSMTSTICFSILRCCRQPLGW